MKVKEDQKPKSSWWSVPPYWYLYISIKIALSRGWGNSKQTEDLDQVDKAKQEMEAFKAMLSKEEDLEESKDPMWVSTSAILKVETTSVALLQCLDGGGTQKIMEFSLKQAEVDLKQRPVIDGLETRMTLDDLSLQMVLQLSSTKFSLTFLFRFDLMKLSNQL